MSIESILTGFGGIAGKAVGDKKNRKAAEKARKQGIGVIESLDYEPTYATDLVPQYQKTQSPVARSYLESFLAGNNPNMTFSGAPNAGLTKQRQQTAQDQMFGTMGERVAKQRALEQQNPYLVKRPDKPVVGQREKAALHGVSNPNAKATGVDEALHAKLVELGAVKPGADLSFEAKGGADGNFARAIRAAAEAGDADAVKFLLNPTLDRPNALLRRRQVRKTNDKARKLVDKYDGED
jgi:hypothetical protein